MAPHSALCICSRKQQPKLIVPICFGTKTSNFCLRIIYFSSLESELSFDLKDSETNFDRARSATQREITAQSFGSNLQYFKRRRGRPLWGRALCILGMESQIRSGGAGKRKVRKRSQGLLWTVNSVPKHNRFPRVFKVRLQLSFIAENAFCQGMVVLLNPVCILLSGMLHVYKSEARVAVFQT